MEEAMYSSLVRYLESGRYPTGFDKKQKYVIRRKSRKFKVKKGLLYHVQTKLDKSTSDGVVVKTCEVERVFTECHTGHKGRDATVAKIRERYYWPNHYKVVQEKVSSYSSST